MSVTGIASGILSELSDLHTRHSKFQQIRGEFQQLAQDLQSGNLAKAQQDFTTLSKNLPGVSQASGSTATATSASGNAQTGTNPLIQAFNKLGQDLQAGNLQGAQQDLTTIEQTAQQNVQQAPSHHHHHGHHVESSEGSSSSSRQASPIAQAFSQLAQDLQGGNLQGAQRDFATLRNDLQQIGGFVAPGSAGASGTGLSSSAGSLNVSA